MKGQTIEIENQSGNDVAFILELKQGYMAKLQEANVSISQEIPQLLSFDNERLVDFIRLEAAKERKFFSIDFVRSIVEEI